MTNQERYRQRVLNDPQWFMRSVLGQNPWEKQNEIVASILQDRRVAVRGCVSSSKTHAGAMAVLAWLNAFFPSRAFTMAPSYRQVENNLWSEIKTMHRRAKIPLGGKLMEGAELKWAHDWFGLGFSTKDPEMVHGLHGPNDLLVIDDAHGVDIKLFDEVENMMAGGNTHILLLYNPVSLTGLTYECAHDQSHLWTNIKIAAETLRISDTTSLSIRKCSTLNKQRNGVGVGVLNQIFARSSLMLTSPARNLTHSSAWTGLKRR